MGVTYTTAAERAIRRTRAVGLDVMELALAGASIVALALVVSVWNPGARETRVGAAPAGAAVSAESVADESTVPTGPELECRSLSMVPDYLIISLQSTMGYSRSQRLKRRCKNYNFDCGAQRRIPFF